ncbi:MAG TPA: hydantoinase B/oxoprolinase family protein, partial [Armatimonadota bacterium]|nr:hydantoinase B/oxoprolinase family protein [Armatimonadota bacterium]
MPTSPDPITAEVFRHLFISVAEEMGVTLERTAYSPNIKERRDHSCALFDRDGLLVAQAAHIPVHLGAFPLLMREIVPRFRWRRGDGLVCNDPYLGGT